MIFTVSQIAYIMLAETDVRIPVKLWSGDFPSQGLNASNTGSLRLGKGLQQLNGTSGNSKCIEITAEVRDRNGSVIENCVARGSGESNVHRYTSMVYKGNSKPSKQVFHSSLPFLIFCSIWRTIQNSDTASRSVSCLSHISQSPMERSGWCLGCRTLAFRFCLLPSAGRDYSFSV